ncbi:hypothetical protein B0H14DRAFT_3508262 [Mycena olivaceomarginata]|nr:hypothetical protein B0H14DRAFT_3508262 [Mycena olivaceomarginata]
MSCHENAKKRRFHGWKNPVLISVTTADRIARAAFMARVRAQLQQPTLEIDPSIVWTPTPSAWESAPDGWGGWGTDWVGKTTTGEWGSGGVWGPEWGPSGGSGSEGSSVSADVASGTP